MAGTHQRGNAGADTWRYCVGLFDQYFLWPPCVADADIILSSHGFFFLSSFLCLFSSLILSRCRMDVYHTSTHDVALVWISDAGLKYAAGGSLEIQDAKIAKIRHLGTIAQLSRAVSSQLRHVSTIEKHIKQQCFLHVCRNLANFGRLTEFGLPVWGIPANFNGFRVLSSVLQRRRSPEANQTLHDVWPSPPLVHYIHFGGLLPLTGFCPVQNSLYAQSGVLLYWPRYCTALQQRTSAKLCGVVQGTELRKFLRRRHIYSAGRPLRWASAQILVPYWFVAWFRPWICTWPRNSYTSLMWGQAWKPTCDFFYPTRNNCHGSGPNSW